MFNCCHGHMISYKSAWNVSELEAHADTLLIDLHMTNIESFVYTIGPQLPNIKGLRNPQSVVEVSSWSWWLVVAVLYSNVLMV